MTIDVSAWQEREERLKRLEAQAAKARRDERDTVIAQAVKDGKFAPARKDFWAQRWDRDPEGIREAIAGMQKGVIPTAEMGYAGGDISDEEIEAEFAHMMPPGFFAKEGH
jgi:hypothetical protein